MKFIPTESLIDYYGTILALAKEEESGQDYLCSWITGKTEPEKYRCVPISPEEVEIVKGDIYEDKLGGSEGEKIKALKKERKSQAINLALYDGELKTL